MITPYEDKTVIKAILDTNDYIKRAGFKATDIKTSRYSTETLNATKPNYQIFIYQGTPENPRNSIQKGIVYNIAVCGPRDESNKIDNISQQIIGLLVNQNLGRSHILHLLDPPMELNSDAGVYIVETAFVCYETIYNKIKN